MATKASGLPSDGPPAFALLAAGRGARFGPGKLLADLGGKPLWRWAIDAAREAGFVDLHVVTNDRRIAAECQREGIACHANPAAAEGIASSIRVAADATRHAARTVIALADMPFVEASHLRLLADAGTVAFTAQADGRRGVPAAFSMPERDRLLELTGDRGAAALYWPNATLVARDSPESLQDVDTHAALERAREIAISRAGEAGR